MEERGGGVTSKPEMRRALRFLSHVTWGRKVGMWSTEAPPKSTQKRVIGGEFPRASRTSAAKPASFAGRVR